MIAPDDSMKKMLLDLLIERLPLSAGQRLAGCGKKNEFFGYIVSAGNLFGKGQKNGRSMRRTHLY